MKTNDVILRGVFCGGEIEPGTFHGGEIELGTFHGGEIEPGTFHDVVYPDIDPITRPIDEEENEAVEDDPVCMVGIANGL